MPTKEEDRAKALRLRKVYIQLRIPRIKTEIAALVTRKKSLMNGSGNEASKEVTEELIYSNQHLAALRKGLESLEQERKTVLEGLREIRLAEGEGKEKPQRALQTVDLQVSGAPPAGQ